MAKSKSDKREEKLLRHMQRKSDSINSKESAIRVAKSKGMIRQGQRGKREIVLTDKGRKAARKAASKSRSKSKSKKSSKR